MDENAKSNIYDKNKHTLELAPDGAWEDLKIKAGGKKGKYMVFVKDRYGNIDLDRRAVGHSEPEIEPK